MPSQSNTVTIDDSSSMAHRIGMLGWEARCAGRAPRRAAEPDGVSCMSVPIRRTKIVSVKVDDLFHRPASSILNTETPVPWGLRSPEVREPTIATQCGALIG